MEYKKELSVYSLFLSMENLATTYSDWRRCNEAEQLEVQVMEIRKKLLGPGHPKTLRSMGTLARTHFSQGNWNEAVQLQVHIVDMKKKMLGTEHPDTLASMLELIEFQRCAVIQNIWNRLISWIRKKTGVIISILFPLLFFFISYIIPLLV